MKQQEELITEVLSSIDQQLLYEQYLPEIEFDASGKARLIQCCFHADNTPSLSIDLEEGGKCFGCNTSFKSFVGFFYSWKTKKEGKKVSFDWCLQKLYSKYVRPLIPKSIVNGYYEQLLESLTKRKPLEDRGIHIGLIKKYKIGFDIDDERYTIPIFDANGWCRDIRKVQVGEVENPRWKNLPYDYRTAKEKRTNGEKTHSEGGRLFPWENIFQDKLFLCEGEWDCMLLNGWGFPAITAGGVDGFSRFYELFRDKEIYIVFDNDPKDDNPGQKGAQKLMKRLYPFASKVINVVLPIKGDITDYYKKGFGSSDFQKLIEGIEEPIEGELIEPDEVITVDKQSELMDVFVPENHNSKVSICGRVTGEDVDHYTVPLAYSLKCDMSFGKACDHCPMLVTGGVIEDSIDKYDNFLFLLSTVNDDKVMKEIKRRHGVKSTCEVVSLIKRNMIGLQQILLSPAIERRDHGAVKDNIHAYNLGRPLELNIEYRMEGYITSYPHTQKTVFVILNAEPTDALLGDFTPPNREDVSRLKRLFNPDKLTKESILEKHTELNEILAHNVTKIYGREHLHSIVDLTYHSILQMPFDNTLLNTYMEAVIIGDTNTGKNWVVDSLSKYYKGGLVLDAGSCTQVGLIGGMMLKKYFSWGAYIQQHRRLLALDEGERLKHTLTALRTVREGKADYSKADAKRQTTCMVRLLILANDPRGAISSNPYPVQAITNLFTQEADVSRFTSALFLRKEDTPMEIINQRRPQEIETEITQEDFQFKVLNAWSITPDRVEYGEGAVEACYSEAARMARKYKSTIMLVQASVQWKKLISVAGALAASQYHMDDAGNKLLITKEYVEAAVAKMEEWYDSKSCEYHRFAEIEKKNSQITDEADVMRKVFDPEKKYGLRQCVELLLETKELDRFSLSDAIMAGGSDGIIDNVIKILVRNKCLVRKGWQLHKTPAFIDLLKRLLQEERKEKEHGEH